MKISCTQENLIQGLNLITHIASKSNHLPILSHILLRAHNKTVTIAATNLEIGSTVTIRAKVDEDGECAVDARLLTDYINLLPKERVDITLIDTNLHIICNKQKTKIKTQSASDFPIIPLLQGSSPITVPAQPLREAIQRVAFAASVNDTQIEISGVLIEVRDSTLILAATDRYRLAQCQIELSQSVPPLRVIVPLKTIQEFARVIGAYRDEDSEGQDVVELLLLDNQISLSYHMSIIVSRLIDATYPDYQPIIPQQHSTQVKVATQPLVKIVKSASLFTKTGVDDIILKFDQATQEITITSSSSYAGENTSRLEAEITGQSNTVILNYHYILDGIQNLGSDEVVIEMQDSINPCVFKSPHTTLYTYIIMPIRPDTITTPETTDTE